MVERERVLNNRFTEKLRKEVELLREINNKGRTLLKLGVALAGVLAVEELSQGNNSEAAVAGIVAGAGILMLAKDPIAWTIDTKEAILEEVED